MKSRWTEKKFDFSSKGCCFCFSVFYRVQYTGQSASASPSTTTTTEPLFQARVPSFARTIEVGSVSPFSPAVAALALFADVTSSPPPLAPPPLRSPSPLCLCCVCCICNICSSSPEDGLEEREGEDDDEDDENTLPKGKTFFDTTATSTSTSSPASSGALNRSDCDR